MQTNCNITLFSPTGWYSIYIYADCACKSRVEHLFVDVGVLTFSIYFTAISSQLVPIKRTKFHENKTAAAAAKWATMGDANKNTRCWQLHIQTELLLRVWCLLYVGSIFVIFGGKVCDILDDIIYSVFMISLWCLVNFFSIWMHNWHERHLKKKLSRKVQRKLYIWVINIYCYPVGFVVWRKSKKASKK